jgi:hypothetical protein
MVPLWVMWLAWFGGFCVGMAAGIKIMLWSFAP